MFEVMSGRALVRLIVPFTLKVIVSETLLLPARHSPAVAPDPALLLAAPMASRNVHKPSPPFATSDRLLTAIVAAGVITPLSGNARLDERLMRVWRLVLALWLSGQMAVSAKTVAQTRMIKGTLA